MAAMGGASKNSAASASAPDKGSFPLDHYHECKSAMERYLACMKKHNDAHALCRDETKAYLECRMNKGLMGKEDIGNFGLNAPIDFTASAKAEELCTIFADGLYFRKDHVDHRGRKGEEGFVAGLGRIQGAKHREK